MISKSFQAKIDSLTTRQTTVLQSVLLGNTDQEIADALEIQTATVRKYIETLCNIFLGKPDLPRERRRQDLIEYFLQHKPEWVQLKNQELDKLPAISVAKQPKRSLNKVHKSKIDWGEAPDTENFVGREEELEVLQILLIDQRCRLLAILASGGMGKSALAKQLVADNIDGFDYVIWRSLRDAPPLDKIVDDLLHHICPEQSLKDYETIFDKINFLFQNLQKYACLIVLDNFETLFVPQDKTGKYRQGYKNYGDFLKRIGETAHRSCILITSREKPSEVVILEGQAVQSRQIKGLPVAFATNILDQKGIQGTVREKEQLVDCYDGNPLALKIVASLIVDVVHTKEISKFLATNNVPFCCHEIDNLLDEQYYRLTPTERSLMYWLAINREFTDLDDLASFVFPPVVNNQLTQAICDLHRRSLVETSNMGYTLQNVIMEYMTERLCQKVSQEIIANSLDKFNRYAFLIATAKDYVRETQRRLIIQRIIELVQLQIKKQEVLINHLNNLINVIRAENLHGYAGGNLIDILVYLQVNLKGYDFSGLTIRQAFLREVELHDVNLENAELHNCIFAEINTDLLTLVFSKNSDLVTGGDTNGNVFVWQVYNRQNLHILVGHKNLLTSIKFSQDERTLITASVDKTVRFWDVNTGICKKVLNVETNYSMSTVIISHKHQILVTSYFNSGRVDLWNLKTGKHLITLLGHEIHVDRICFSHNDKLIATRDRKGNVILWSVNNGKILQNITEISPSYFLDEALAFNKDETILITATKDFSLEFWDIADVKKVVHLTTIPKAHTNKISCVVVSLNNQIMVTAGADRNVKLWNITNSQNPQLLSILAGHSSWITSLEFSPDGKFLITASSDKTIKWWNIEKPNKPHLVDDFRGCSNNIRGLVFSHDSKILVSSSDDRTVRLWDVKTGRLLQNLLGHSERVVSITFSPNGKILASASWDYTVKLWDLKSDQCLATLVDHTDQVYSLAFLPDQKHLISVGDDYTVKVWNIHKKQLVNTWQPNIQQLHAVAVVPNSQLIAIAGYQAVIKLLDPYNGKIYQTFTGHQSSIFGLALSPNGKYLASSSEDRTVKLWDMQTGEELKTFTSQETWYYKIAFSPNGQFLAFGSQDNTICIWDSHQDEYYYLEGHHNNVLTVAFSPDNQTLASGSYDGIIKLWNMQLNKCQATLKIPLPYAGMNIRGIRGIAKVEQQTLQALGAVR